MLKMLYRSVCICSLTACACVALDACNPAPSPRWLLVPEAGIIFAFLVLGYAINDRVECYRREILDLKRRAEERERCDRPRSAALDDPTRLPPEFLKSLAIRDGGRENARPAPSA